MLNREGLKKNETLDGGRRGFFFDVEAGLLLQLGATAMLDVITAADEGRVNGFVGRQGRRSGFGAGHRSFREGVQGAARRKTCGCLRRGAGNLDDGGFAAGRIVEFTRRARFTVFGTIAVTALATFAFRATFATFTSLRTTTFTTLATLGTATLTAFAFGTTAFTTLAAVTAFRTTTFTTLAFGATAFTTLATLGTTAFTTLAFRAATVATSVTSAITASVTSFGTATFAAITFRAAFATLAAGSALAIAVAVHRFVELDRLETELRRHLLDDGLLQEIVNGFKADRDQDRDHQGCG